MTNPTPEALEAVALAIDNLCDDRMDNGIRWEFSEDLARAAITAYEAAQWRPIESAPKDGTWVLLWCGWCIEGRWFENGERVQNQWSDDGMGVNPIFHVTHWRPLPPPPA